MKRASNPTIRKDAIDVDVIGGWAGFTRKPVGWVRMNHDLWAVDYLYHGEVLQQIGAGRKHLRKPGVAFLFAPGTQYGQCCTENPYRSSAALFQMTGWAHLQFQKLLGPAGYWQVLDEDGLIGERLMRLGAVEQQLRPGFRLSAHGILTEMLGLLQDSERVRGQTRRVRRDESPAREQSLLGKVERYIVDHMREPIGVNELAEHLGISASKLAHAYPRLAGETPYHTVLRLKVAAIKQLLLHKELSVKECAEHVGFSSPFQLSRAFKRIEGVSPRQYQLTFAKRSY